MSSHERRLRAVEDLIGPAGRLEALLNEGRDGTSYSALVCHPHPLGGGTMHNKVVYQTAKVFEELGIPVLRFNFRGTGLSEGEYDRGLGEVDDVHAALNWLDRQFHLPILMAGFSFGSNVGLRACCGDARVRAIAALGLPIRAGGRDYDYEFLAHCNQPKLFLSGTQDEYGPVELLRAAVALAAPPVKMVWIEGASHFFDGRLGEMQQALREWLDDFLSGGLR